MQRPEVSEYAEFYRGYVNHVPEGPILGFMSRQLDAFLAGLHPVPEQAADYRYAPGKWSIKQLVAHMADTERVFGFRALAFSRLDPSEYPGMDQDDYTNAIDVSKNTLRDFVDQFETNRHANIALYKTFDETMAMRTGKASGFSFSVRAMVWITAGHAEHHLKQLNAKYLPGI